MLVFLAVQPQLLQTPFDSHPGKTAETNDSMMDKLDSSAAGSI
jgi:hypothetical protein